MTPKIQIDHSLKMEMQRILEIKLSPQIRGWSTSKSGLDQHLMLTLWYENDEKTLYNIVKLIERSQVIV